MLNTAASLPRPMMEAIVARAEFHAKLAVECLRWMDEQNDSTSFPGVTGQLPAGFLLEVGAVAQILAWEWKGIHRFLPADLPTSKAAADDLYRRAMERPQELAGTSGATLSQKVLDVCLTHLSWASPDYFETECVLGDVDEDVLIEAVARLIWEHRHD